MVERQDASPADAKQERKEGKKKINWHLTELPSGSWSVGATEDEVGHHPADEDTNTAEAWVAPADFVDNHPSVKEHGHNDQAIREAIRDWMRQQEHLK